MKKLLEPVKVWYSVQNGGDGSAYPKFFLTEEETEYDQENAYEGWGETCNGSVDTYVDSLTYRQAVENSEDQAQERAEKAKEKINKKTTKK